MVVSLLMADLWQDDNLWQPQPQDDDDINWFDVTFIEESLNSGLINVSTWVSIWSVISVLVGGDTDASSGEDGEDEMAANLTFNFFMFTLSLIWLVDVGLTVDELCWNGM